MFADLLDNPKQESPGKVQECASKSFSARISKSHFKERRPAHPITAPQYVILGIAVYSRPELSLLDEITNKYHMWQNNFEIYVFDICKCASVTDADEFLPGIEYVENSPVVGIWNGSGKPEFQSGLRFTRDLLAAQDII